MEGGYGELDAKNNLAYCYLKKEKYAEAMKLLDSAAQIGPQYPQVYWNRATIGLCAEYMHDKLNRGRTIADCKRVLELHPNNVHVEVLAAKIFAQVSDRDPAMLERSLELLEMASKHGFTEDRDSLAKNLAFEGLRENPRFLKAIQAAPMAGNTPTPESLIEPELAFLTSQDH
ncbi:MAG: hypothetical protein K8T91_02815 [Planctomycetes bacterium]|nr:hypothetical protein [Planctomycetota bacterium]